LVVADIAARLAARWFYDWSGGLVWLAAPADGDGGAAIVHAAAAARGGHATLFRAPADVRARESVFQPLAEPLMKLTRGLKDAFDPDGVLNPGRMYADV
jgi:glycolate oxidase FAD binding subunit